MSRQSSIINAMLSVNAKIARNLIRDFSELQLLQSSKRPLDNFKDNTKRRLQEIVLNQLNLARPQYGLISKEITENEDAEKRWVVTILEGEENFMRSIPYFAFSLAVEEMAPDGDREIIAGMIFAPVLNELYFAEKDAGAWQEHGGTRQVSRIKVAEPKEGGGILATNNMSDADASKSIRILGSDALSLAYVGAGKVDSCALNNVHFCDVAAGLIIAKEGGAQLSSYKYDQDLQIDRISAS